MTYESHVVLSKCENKHLFLDGYRYRGKKNLKDLIKGKSSFADEIQEKAKNLQSIDKILSKPRKTTHSIHTFLDFVSCKSNNRVLLIATLPALDLLLQSEICHCNGTFLVAPSVFYQAYTIHGVIENRVILLVHSLLPNKTPDTKLKIFLAAKSSFEKIVIDFEAGFPNAIRKKQPEARIQFCFFHLGQAG